MWRCWPSRTSPAQGMGGMGPSHRELRGTGETRLSGLCSLGNSRPRRPRQNDDWLGRHRRGPGSSCGIPQPKRNSVPACPSSPWPTAMCLAPAPPWTRFSPGCIWGVDVPFAQIWPWWVILGMSQRIKMSLCLCLFKYHENKENFKKQPGPEAGWDWCGRGLSGKGGCLWGSPQ